MFGFEDIQNAKNKTLEVRKDKQANVFEEAKKLLRDFKVNGNIELLQKAARKLSETLELNKDHAQSYFLLAYIFYVLDNAEFALKYFNKGEVLCQNIPHDLARFKQTIKNKLNYNLIETSPFRPADKDSLTREKEQALAKMQVPAPVKVVVPKTSSFWKGFRN